MIKVLIWDLMYAKFSKYDELKFFSSLAVTKLIYRINIFSCVSDIVLIIG